jgi:hypothetical protein
MGGISEIYVAYVPDERLRRRAKGALLAMTETMREAVKECLLL